MSKMGVKLTFGIQQYQIDRIEQESKMWDSFLTDEDALKPGWRKYDKDFWEKLGREFGWHPLVLALTYFEKIHENTTQ